MNIKNIAKFLPKIFLILYIYFININITAYSGVADTIILAINRLDPDTIEYLLAEQPDLSFSEKEQIENALDEAYWDSNIISQNKLEELKALL